MIEVYDNGGETVDRYTVIIDGDVYTMSDNPLSPQGVNQYAGKLHELPLARQGERTVVESLPEAVQKAIEQRQSPKRAEVKVTTDEVDGREIINVDYIVKGETVASVELYVFNDIEDSDADTDEYLVKYYRPEYEDNEDPKILIQGNI